MGSIDSKNHIRDKEMYRSIIDRQSRSHEAEKKQLEARHELAETQQRENFLKQKDETEKNFGDRYESLGKSQKDALFEKERAYNKEVERQKVDFYKDHNETKNGFEKKLSSIKNEFDRANGIQKDYHKIHLNQMADRYDTAVSGVRTQAEESVNNYKENAIGNNKNHSAQMAEEKNNLQKRHEEELNSLMRTELKKQNNLKLNAIADVDKMREARTKERIDAQDKRKENFERVNMVANEKVKQVKEATDLRTKNLVEKQAESNIEQNRTFRDRFVGQERKFNQERREERIKNKALIVTPGSLQYKIQEEGKKDKAEQLQAEKQVLLDERDGVLQDTSKMLDKSRVTYQESLSDVKVDNAEKLRDLNWAHTAEQTSTATRARSEKAELAKKFNDTEVYNEKIAFQKVENVKDKTGHEVARLKQNFKTSLERMQNKQNILFNQIKEEAAAEKKVMAKNFTESNSDDKAIQRKRFLDKIEKMSQGYETKIMGLENANKEIRQMMTNKMNELSVRMNDKLAEHKEISKKALETEVSAEREVSRQKEMQLRRSMSQQQNNFLQKMNDLRMENQNALQKVTFDYEAQMKEQSKKYQDIIDQNKRFSDREMSRLNLSSQDERNRLIVQYEEQIKQMKNLFERKELEIKQFNKLSQA